MAVVIDTASVPESERFAYWSDAVPRADIYPYRIQRDGSDTFWGAMATFDLGWLQVARVRAAASMIVRDSRCVRSFDTRCFMLTVQLRGSCSVTQHGRRATLNAGDMAGYDSGVPYSVLAPGSYDVAVYRIPLQLLGPNIDAIQARSASPIRGGTGVACAAVPFLRHLLYGLEKGEVTSADAALSGVVLDVVRALYKPEARAQSFDAVDVPETQLATIKEYIESNLRNPQLCVDGVAAAHFISTRRLYQLFQRDGWSVAGWIRARRLERCRQDLRSPRCTDEPIAQIAHRWGFPSPAHFSRLFRATYGCTPRECREELDRVRTSA